MPARPYSKRRWDGVCPACGIEPRGAGGYCPNCTRIRSSARVRVRRLYADLLDAERLKAKARSTANVYLRRGKLIRQQCEVCGATAQMHHDDYSRPLDIRWLCAKHHRAHHSAENASQP